MPSRSHPMMLSRLILGNFKAYDGVVDVPLRRITLLFGANSGGKSTIIQSLLLLKQTQGDLPLLSMANDSLVLRGDQVDLGSFVSMVHGHDMSRSVTIGASSDDPGEPGASIVLRQESLDSNIEVVRQELRIFGQVMQLLPASSGEGREGRSEIRPSRQSIYRGEVSAFAKALLNHENREALDRVFVDLDWEQCLTDPEFVGLFVRRGALGLNIRDFERADGLPQADIESDWDYQEDGDARPRFGRGRGDQDYPANAVLNDVVGSVNRMSGMIGRLSYLGPLRAMPERLHVVSGERVRGVGSAGENVVSVLAGSPRDIERVNAVLVQMGIPYELSIKKLTDPDTLGAIGEIYSLLLRDTRTGVGVAATDVGFGISQVLPVIVECLNSRGGPLIIEQPEIHLHPALQTQLADLFVDASSRGRQIIAETHSEHLILRLQRLVRRGLISPDEISVLYVGGGRVDRLRLNERGEFIDEWPGGFFDERLEELFGD